MEETNEPSYLNQDRGITPVQRFAAFIEATSDIVYRLSADWEVMHELDGRGFLKNSDRPISGWKEINVFVDDLELVNKRIEEAISEKKIFELEHRVNQVNGLTGWTFSRAIPLLSEDGEILEWVGTAKDITARKNAELSLTSSHEMALDLKTTYETITSSTPDLMYLFDLDYRFIYANEALLAMWGKKAEDAIGKGMLENGYEPWHAQMHKREIDQVVLTGKPIRGEVTFPHAIEGTRYYDYIFTPVFGTDGKVRSIAGTTRDVTELRRALELLQLSSNDLGTTNEKLVEANVDLVSANGLLLVANDELKAAKKQVSKAQTALRQAIDAANFGTWSVDGLLSTLSIDARGETLLDCSPNEKISLLSIANRIDREFRQAVIQDLNKAKRMRSTFDISFPLRLLPDNRLRWIRAIGDFGGSTPSEENGLIAGILMDVTEQKNDELRKNDFIGMVSHELKTPITSTKAFIQVALNRLSEGLSETAIVAIRKADNQTSKMAKMIDGFLNLSRLESGKITIHRDQTNLKALLDEVKDDVYTSIFSHTILFDEIESVMIYADGDKIIQVVHNLISNAIKYSPLGSVIRVACTESDHYASISVCDDGMGIAAKDINRIFEPYYRAESREMMTVAGFGIGLYVCKEIITLHGGEIWAESLPGKGSKFIIRIPVS
ncbi:PAS domain-containing sensor histidine kinase [Pedobacter sandarakinus]|uniref:PAS domain-containing sensor histidine kinase n=1 Tax=Pedobacter sandarakinus TaxID=353156 RepID=UPI0022453E2C|nr:PAS domain-containing sensor histidine kinase [Pedobacter sandarakinus]MCX2575396.1 PAS domain-containing sensor histidine kinase [Pedobacter sandarakinus]